MTTLQQTHPPILLWELYEYDNLLRGHCIDWLSSWKAKERYPVSYEFKGQKAIYIVCTNDASISRESALEWCKAHFLGRLVTTRIDLTSCQVRQIK